jgi:general secretion pathway protein D
MTVVTKAKFRGLIILLMVAGGFGDVAVDHASAQDTPAPAPTKRPRRPRAPRNQTPAPEPEPVQPVTPAQQAAPASPTAAGEQGAPQTPIKPFETGIDYQPTSPNTRVTFNLEDADLPELVRMMSQITGRSFILPSKSRSIKATVYAPT